MSKGCVCVFLAPRVTAKPSGSNAGTVAAVVVVVLIVVAIIVAVIVVVVIVYRRRLKRAKYAFARYDMRGFSSFSWVSCLKGLLARTHTCN